MIKAIIFDLYGVIIVDGLPKQRDENLLNLISALKKEYKIGLLSNTGKETLDTYFSEKERGDYFDVRILSGEVGYSKPDPEIFTLCKESLGVEQFGECLFIDDNESFCQAAHALGMKTITYRSFAQCEEDIKHIIGEENHS